MAKFLGVPTSGSQGATTWGRNRYGQYTRMRAHPVNPNTPAQRQARSALSGCASAWRELTAAQQIAWNEFGKTQRRKGPLGQEHTLTGFSAFIMVNSANARVEQPLLTVPPALPTFTEGAAFSISNTTTDACAAAYQGPDIALPELVFVETSHELSAGVSFNNSYYYLANYTDLTAGGSLPLATNLLELLGILMPGYKLFIRFTLQINGIKGPSYIAPFVLTGTAQFLTKEHEAQEKERAQIRAQEEAKEKAAAKNKPQH